MIVKRSCPFAQVGAALSWLALVKAITVDCHKHTRARAERERGRRKGGAHARMHKHMCESAEWK